MRATSILLAVAAAAAAPACRDRHADCQTWAGQGECQNNPGYMLESCAVACDSCGVRRDAFGHRVNLYGPEMTDHDRDTFANNLRRPA